MAKDRNQSELDSTDWNAAVAAVNRLAGARRTIRDLHVEAGAKNAPGSKPADNTGGDELARAHQEIEKAAAALQVVQPNLTTWSEPIDEAQVPTRRRSVWIVMGLIWAGMVAVVITAIQAVKSLM